MLFLDHDIIFYFLTMLKKCNKNLSKVLNTFENVMENGAFAPKEQMLHFPYIFKYMIFQRSQKALLWSKGLKLVIITSN